MKRILLSAAVLLFVIAAFAGNPPDVNEKVLTAFKKTFDPQAEVTWYENDNSFEARFTTDGIRTIVWYTKKGELMLTHRHYGCSSLPPFVHNSILDKNPKYKIAGVTEITNRSGIYYYVTLESKTHWMKIKADIRGDYDVEEKFKKS